MSFSAAMRKTKIVCTLGPATNDEKSITALAQAGMNVARLNFSHGDHQSHTRAMATVRRVSASLHQPLGILLDLAGPKIRLGEITSNQRRLDLGTEVELFSGESSDGSRLPVNYPYLAKDVEPGDRILLADGLVELKVIKENEGRVLCLVVVGGELSSRKGLNLPQSSLRIPAFTPKDEKDLGLGLREQVDFVAMSFVRHEDDLTPVLELLSQADPRPLLIAKIEKPQALDRFTEILARVDGIMVARGDLGVETPLERVPLVQKRLIRQARRAGKLVITATQMLRSMIASPRPTRAEAADVANAVLDGTDAVMLSEETAVGAYPTECVAVLDRITRATEPALQFQDFLGEPVSELLPSIEAAVTRAVCYLAKDLDPSVLVASTNSGATARLMARYRNPFPVAAMTPRTATFRQLTLSWGVIPVLVPAYETADEMFAQTAEILLDQGLAQKGSKFITTAGIPVGVPGTTNLIKVVEVPQ